jgi:hypothetical protein
LLEVVAVMVMTGVARQIGVPERIAGAVFLRAGVATRLFAPVRVWRDHAVLNNASAILLLTPLCVDAARSRHPRLVVPLAFAVFLSAGVAPLIVSNPMNMVVASYAGIGFNEYAVRMALPLAGRHHVHAARIIFHAKPRARGGAGGVGAGGERGGRAAFCAPQRAARSQPAAVVPRIRRSWFGGRSGSSPSRARAARARGAIRAHDAIVRDGVP